MTYNDEFLTVEFTEDSLKLTAKKDGTFKSAGETANVTVLNIFSEAPTHAIAA